MIHDFKLLVPSSYFTPHGEWLPRFLPPFPNIPKFSAGDLFCESIAHCPDFTPLSGVAQIFRPGFPKFSAGDLFWEKLAQI